LLAALALAEVAHQLLAGQGVVLVEFFIPLLHP
jgi:hypothetical protein